MGLSTHILDTALGRPASGVKLALAVEHDGAWQAVSEGVTDADGRCRSLLDQATFKAAIYRLRFDTAGYYHEQQTRGLYPFVDIVFRVDDPGQHFHIPLLLTANGYTTYRGS